MPTADSFTALGRGNGFPSCLGKVDVSVYDHWVTLGGTEKGNTATGSEKSLSLVNAMKLYWNLYSASSSSNSSISYSSENFNFSFTKNSSATFAISPAPRERTCKPQVAAPSVFAAGFTEAELDESGGASCSSSGRWASFGSLTLVRMYDGSTGNQSNFVGYGVGNLYRGSGGWGHMEGVNSGGASIEIASYLDGNSGSGQVGPDPQGDPSVSYFDRTAATTTIGGIPFRSFTRATAFTVSDQEFSKTLTSGPTSASASASFDGDANGSASVNSLVVDFYTY